MEIQNASDPIRLRAALGLMLDRTDSSPDELDVHVEAMVRYARRRGFRLDTALLAYEAGQPVAACLPIDTPGRVTSLFLPDLKTWRSRPLQRCKEPQPVLSELIAVAVAQAAQRGNLILQAMLAPDAHTEAELLRQARFEPLATLASMSLDPTQAVLPSGSAPAMEWMAYHEQSRELFGRTIRQTYLDSLDCVSLNERRGIDDILASHESAGEFQPADWRLALAAGEPVGVLLLSRSHDRWAGEVVYMGVVPAARRTGLGRTLLRYAIATARERAWAELVLSVDLRNAPALALYRRTGFQETGQRAVWLRYLTDPSG